jgi:hypothetical protein
VVEEKVEIKVLVADFKMNLPSYKGEACPSSSKNFWM